MTSRLDAALGGLAVEGVTGGHGWLSLRLGAQFLWLVAMDPLRAVWIGPEPMPGPWLDLLGRHRTPFAAHLRGRVVRRAQVLATDDGCADGLRIDFDDVVLSIRFFPRPGGVWLNRSSGEELAQTGRMGNPLTVTPGTADFGFDVGAHAQAARRQLLAALVSSLRGRLTQSLSSRAKKDDRLLASLLEEQERARSDAALRASADVLASQLHRLRAKESRVELTDFEGRPLSLALDAMLSPAQNLARLYKRAAKADRTLEALGPRLAAQHERIATTARAWRELADVADDLEALLAFASRHALRATAAAPSRAMRQKPGARLPYRAYRLASGREVWVGRSARDNDVLTQRHAHGKDLWLHAQGVEGSHVVLRTGGQPAPSRDIDAAARLAAQFSKAKHSQTVPVLVTEKRYVRKPRGSAPGSVVAERAKTLFVSPGIPAGCEVVRSD